ncbi:MAG: C2H2-type zinc finger protein [Desulfurococcaceae archaeon]
MELGGELDNLGGLKELAVKAKKRKYQQIVWIEADVFARLAELSAKFGVAINTIISEIVKKYFESGIEPIKVIKETVPAPAGFYCPLCIRRFTRPSELVDHIRSSECGAKIKEVVG